MENIQTNLLSAFDASGITYDELAKRTNLPKSALHRYINGETEKIPIDRFQAICKEINVDAGALLGWREEPHKDPPEEKPKNDNIRLLIRGLNKLSPEQVERAKEMMKLMFDKYFDEESNDET